MPDNDFSKAPEAKTGGKTVKLVIIAAVIVALLIAAFLIFTKVVVPARKYNAARALMDAGRYEEAIEVFEGLDGYKDSEEMIRQSREGILQQKYDAAMALMEAGKYEEAIAAFTALDYGDSAEMVLRCKYEIALALMEDGRYEEAIAAFSALDYGDSQDKIAECETAITDRTYNEALALMAEGKYVDAAAILKDLGYKDSAEKYEECKAAAPYDFINIGDIITFGKYEQDADKSNGPEPLTWRVLDKQDGKVLIITEHLIDELPYWGIYYKHSHIRGFLTGSFLNDFTPEEKAMIVETVVEPDPHPKAPNTDQGSALNQTVFLLSVTEAEKYFADDADRVCGITAYTNWFGAFGLDEGTAYPWWLRTAYWAGPSSAIIAAVDANGQITTYRHNRNCAIRPACWIQLEG